MNKFKVGDIVQVVCFRTGDGTLITNKEECMRKYGREMSKLITSKKEYEIIRVIDDIGYVYNINASGLAGTNFHEDEFKLARIKWKNKIED